MTKPTAAELAVERFETAQEELDEFLKDNSDFADELRRLVDNYNAAIKEAATSMKSDLRDSNRNKLMIGKFGVVKRRRDYWDGLELAAIVPGMVADQFLTEVLSYEVNVGRLEQMIRQGEVDRDEVHKAYHRKDPVMSLVPGTPKEMKI